MRTTSAITLLTCLALTACNGEGDETGETGVVCDNTVTLFPAKDATGVYYRTSIEAAFAKADETATLAVAAGSEAVAGTTSWNDAGTTLTFTPDAPLNPSTQHTASVTHECGDANVDWTTSDVGTAVDVDLAGKAYSMDLTSGRFLQPEGIGALIQNYIDTDILMGVTSADDTTIQMIGAVANGETPAAQDVCEPTFDFPAADFAANPFFTVGPESTAITIQGYTVTITDLMISGAFSPDGSYVDGAVLAGSIDTRPLVPMLDENGGDDAICVLASSLGINCEECAEDGGMFCLTLYVDSMTAEEIGTSLVEVVDPSTNPDCDEEPAGE